MKKRRLTALFTAAALTAALLAGCGSGGTTTTAAAEDTSEAATEAAGDTTEAETTEAATEAETLDPEENYDTGDASLDNPRNQDEIGETELLVVSFGTSYNDSRRLTIGAIEEAMEAAFPDYSVRRAFTSQIILDHVESRDGEVMDNVEEALEREAEPLAPAEEAVTAILDGLSVPADQRPDFADCGVFTADHPSDDRNRLYLLVNSAGTRLYVVEFFL